MSNMTADDLLDAALASTEEPTESADKRIILSIDEPSRTISYDGELILGVKGDRFSERIYFECPRYVYKESDEIIDLSLNTTRIYINYKNAQKEPYIEECTKHGEENGNFMFSWFLSEYVTIRDGKVQFNVCVKDENTLTQEWHTTVFEGVVLPSIDVSGKTPEVITSETRTTQSILDEIDEYKQAVERYEAKVDTEVSAAMDTYKSETDTYLADRMAEIYTQLSNYYVVISITQASDGSYSSDFNFNDVTSDNMTRHVCVVDRSAYGYSNIPILTPIEFAINSPIKLMNFSNGELSLQVQRNSETGTTTIFENNMIVPIAEEVYQTTTTNYTTETGDVIYDSFYPILCSDNNSFIEDGLPTSNGVLRNPQVTVCPNSGVIDAKAFKESGKLLSVKYAPALESYQIYLYSSSRVDGNSVIHEIPRASIYLTNMYSFSQAKYIKIKDANNNSDTYITIPVSVTNLHGPGSATTTTVINGTFTDYNNNKMYITISFVDWRSSSDGYHIDASEATVKLEPVSGSLMPSMRDIIFNATTNSFMSYVYILC